MPDLTTQAPIKAKDRDITERDFALLRGLFECRVMTLAHAAALYFTGSSAAAMKRVQKLKAVGLIAERPRRRQYDPSILFLAKRGFEMLHRQGRLVDYPVIGSQTMAKRVRVSPLTLQHELDMVTVKATLTAALRSTESHTVEEFSTWPRLFSFDVRRSSPGSVNARFPRRGRPMPSRPDGFLRVRENDRDGFGALEHLFYLELDRSTETHGNLLAKSTGYVEHYRGGGMASRFGAPQEAFKKYPFRVLWIYRNHERRNNAAAALLRHRPPILRMMWLTTFGELNSDPLSAIWVRPLDYQDATRGTPYDPHAYRPEPVYRRQPDREELVERLVRKHMLFESGNTPAKS